MQWAGPFFFRDAVLEDEGVHTELVEEFGNLPALVIHGEVSVAATGTDDDSGTIRFGGKVSVQFRSVVLAVTDGVRGLATPEWSDRRRLRHDKQSQEEDCVHAAVVAES